MTELDTYTQQPVPAVPQMTQASQSIIRETALTLNDAITVARHICNSAFAPAHFRGKPEETAVAMMYGATVGFDPITAVQQIFVIGGKPALYSRAQVAVLIAAGHKIWTEDESDGSVTVCGQRKGGDKIERVTWTIAMAEKAGYTKNAKYRTDPRSMLYARASGDVARRVAPDALLGLAYNVEEMQLVEQRTVPAAEAATGHSAKDRVREAVGAQTSGPAGASGDTAPTAPPAAPTAGSGDHISDAQSKKLHALVGDLGLTRDQKIAGVCLTIGRQVTTTSDLTRAEAAQVIDSLEAKVASTRQGNGPDEDGAYLAETVDDDIVALQDECRVAGAAIGMNAWSIEESFAKRNEGLTFADATAEQLQAFHAWLSSPEAKASA